MILNQNKKRRRRKKKTEIHYPNQLSVAAATLPSTTKFPNPTVGFTKPKLKQFYLKEEKDVNSALLLHSTKITQEQIDAKKIEEYDFFTDSILVETFECSTDVVDEISYVCVGEKPIRRTTSPISSIDKVINEACDVQQLASSYIQVEDDNFIEKWERKRVKPRDENILFYPQAEILNLNQDITDDPNIRNLEDEGLFVWPNPVLLKKNEHKMINRFLEDGSEGWIQKINGMTELIGQRNFIEHQLVKTESTKIFRSIFFEPRPVDEVIVGHNSSIPDSFMTLKIHISDLIFEKSTEANTDDESIIARKIEVLYEQYLERQRNGSIVERLQNKLNTLRKLTASKFNEEKLTADKLRQFKFDRRDIRNELHRERTTDREILRSVLEHWTELKEVRKKQGFNSTALKLVIKTENVDEVRDLEKWEATFAMELNEILEETIEYCNEKRRTHKSRKDFKTTNESKPNPDEIEDRLHDVYMKSMRYPGEPFIFLELHKISVAIANTNAIPDPAIRYSIQMIIDREKVTSVKSLPLISVGALNKVYINRMFTIQLSKSIPKNVQLLVSTFYLHNLF